MLKIQPCFPSAIGKGFYSTMVKKAIPIEDDFFETFVDGSLGKELARKYRFGDLAFEDGLLFDCFFVAAGSHDGVTRCIVYDLAVNVFGASIHCQSRPLNRTDDLLPDSFFSLQPDNFLCVS
jgi:hypothetical protein